jgi:hypothetical protein
VKSALRNPLDFVLAQFEHLQVLHVFKVAPLDVLQASFRDYETDQVLKMLAKFLRDECDVGIVDVEGVHVIVGARF